MKFSAVVLALCAVGASAFMPQAQPKFMATKLFLTYGKYDDQLWDISAKKDVFAEWDPEQPRSETNFNPFERVSCCCRVGKAERGDGVRVATRG